jgi:cytochrome c556
VLFASFVLVLAQSPINIHVDGEKWWVTASVAVGAALLGSFFGAIGLYYASVRLEGQRRKALSEIRRKAKVYTPIREELVALRRAIAEDRHLDYGVLRDRSDNHWARNPPYLVIWREFVDDGRANTTASPRIREALARMEGSADAFNKALKAARDTFQERGDAITEQSGFTADWPGQLGNEFKTLYRHGVREARIYREYPSPSDPHKDVSPLRRAPATLTVEQTAFVNLWEADEAMRGAATKLGEAERGLAEAAEATIAELDKAMKRIADDYEHEPD